MTLAILTKRNTTILIVLYLLVSCKKYSELPPPTVTIADDNVYTSNSTAIAVLNGIYSDMSRTGVFTGNRSISLYSGLSADEFALKTGVTSETLLGYYNNALSAKAPISGSEFWSPLYNYILKCNAAIEGLQKKSAEILNPKVKSQLYGEALFLRGYFYFYLTNLFGDVPMPLSTDYKINTLLKKTPKDSVLNQVKNDLAIAKTYLSEEYLDASLLGVGNERIRPTKSAASAMLARIYLYTNDYVNANFEASNLIDRSNKFKLDSLNNVFLKNSNEAIWQVQPTTLNFNTEDARTFILTSTGPTNSALRPAFLSQQLLNSFEAGDLRLVSGNWVKSIKVSGITYYFPYKYKINLLDPEITISTGSANMKEYLMLLRLGEQYLIRAEARTFLGDWQGANNDLWEIRKRAGLQQIYLSDKETLIKEIIHERQVELFTELGQRWLDMKRMRIIDSIMVTITPLKSNGRAWYSYQQLYPIPQNDISKSPNLFGQQNPGY